MSDYAEMADGPIEPTPPAEQPPAGPEPPYIRYNHWQPTPGYDTRTLADKLQAQEKTIGEMAAAMQKMQESICHLELHVHRLLNQEGEL